ncbi:hypothetical protein [Ornithinibacillus gellani]|uniref:hypothetical protein n=1 Tax=Ornithinibacillus gellani TaxID=2293253 RepID=UPI0016812DFE|nr:hypothetical protein [Ornithinibacillus gellani]
MISSLPLHYTMKEIKATSIWFTFQGNERIPLEIESEGIFLVRISLRMYHPHL